MHLDEMKQVRRDCQYMTLTYVGFQVHARYLQKLVGFRVLCAFINSIYVIIDAHKLISCFE